MTAVSIYEYNASMTTKKQSFQAVLRVPECDSGVRGLTSCNRRYRNYKIVVELWTEFLAEAAKFASPYDVFGFDHASWQKRPRNGHKNGSVFKGVGYFC